MAILTMRQFNPEEGMNLPFTVANMRGNVVITLTSRATPDPILDDTRAYQWIAGVPGRVMVDVSRLQMMNASCMSWLVNLMRAAKPAKVLVIGADAQSADDLRVLGLNAR